MTRLNKFLADQGVCSRRAADKLIDEGRVLVNGRKPELGQKVGDSDKIEVNGRVIGHGAKKEIVIAYNKPVGIITSVDPNAKDTVIDDIGMKEKIFPIGRLDVASSGLLLLTNNGELSERITHPRYHHEKEYLVTTDRFLKDSDLDIMRKGMEILGKMTKKAKVERVGTKTFKITLTEGRNRQIRRMCEALGYDISRLKRLRVMNIDLGDLETGKWRKLTKQERAELKKLTGV